MSTNDITNILVCGIGGQGVMTAAEILAGRPNNERLEFLGDALLNLLVAEFIYECLPKASEGEITRLRAALVSGAALAQLAREFDLGEHVLLGPGELKSGGFRRD